MLTLGAGRRGVEVACLANKSMESTCKRMQTSRDEKLTMLGEDGKLLFPLSEEPVANRNCF
jgi:hypothetical protein